MRVKNIEQVHRSVPPGPASVVPVLCSALSSFRAGSADLSHTANRTLLKLVHFLQLNPQRKIRIEGYSDSRGDAQENLALSQARAQTVADLLINLGVAAERVEVRGYGERFPLAENASARGRAQNRRVEILFSDAEGNLGPDR